MTLRLVAVCGDPGGASAVAPVLELMMRENRVKVDAFAYRQACDVWQKRGMQFEALDEAVPQEEIDSLLRIPETRLLLTGTSVNGVDLEKRFIASARNRQLPSLALLDYWSNYGARFSVGEGKPAGFPDRIAVMDEWARDEMLAEGFDATRLAVTGQPAFDSLLGKTLANDVERQRIRDGLNIANDELVVLFASQPLAEVNGLSRGDSQWLGYDEKSVLSGLLRALDELSEAYLREIVLLVLPHPRENRAIFAGIGGNSVRVLVAAHGDALGVAKAADVVTGMNSVLLMESCYSGLLTVSLQPGLRRADSLPASRLGVCPAVYRDADMLPVLDRMLFDSAARADCRAKLAEFVPDGKAARRVADLAYRMAGVE